MDDEARLYLAKAQESLAGADSEFANGCYNNCANRCYYACFQAAIVALIQAHIRPPGQFWSHAFVQARFARDLINQRKVFPSEMRGTLGRLLVLRQEADYSTAVITETQALRAIRRGRALVEVVRFVGGQM